MSKSKITIEQVINPPSDIKGDGPISREWLEEFLTNLGTALEKVINSYHLVHLLRVEVEPALTIGEYGENYARAVSHNLIVTALSKTPG